MVLIISLLLLVAGIYWFQKKAKVYDKAPRDFVMLRSAVESRDYLPVVEEGWLEEIEVKYSQEEWKSYPNEHTEQHARLYEGLYKLKKDDMSSVEFLNRLTKEQRMYFALANFEAQTNNGGVYQFLFNYPSLAILTLQAMEYANLGKLAEDYKMVLDDFFGKFNTIQDLQRQFQDSRKKWDKRWNLFVSGYKELPTTEKIEAYFYTKEYQKEYQSKIIHFVKKIETD